jgi:hypothetical protein
VEAGKIVQDETADQQAMGDRLAALESGLSEDGLIPEEEDPFDPEKIFSSISWLQETLQASRTDMTQRKLNFDGEVDLLDVTISWIFLFDCVKNPDGDPIEFVTHETVEIALRLVGADLWVEMGVSVDGEEVLLHVGVPFKTMVDESSQMHLRLRLALTRGSHEFSASHQDFYYQYTYDDGSPYEIFSSAHKQIATYNRLKRVAMLDPENRLRMKPKAKLLKKARKAIDNQQMMRSYDVKALLIACGGYRTDCEKTLGANVARLQEKVDTDPFFMCFHDSDLEEASEGANTGKNLAAREQRDLSSETLAHAGLEPVTYDEITAVVEFLEKWHFTKNPKEADVLTLENGEGSPEEFVGTLKMFFPAHDPRELAYLRTGWARPGMMMACSHVGFSVEGAGTLSRGHEDNVAKTQFPGFMYQPLDHVRDYCPPRRCFTPSPILPLCTAFLRRI